MGKGLGHLCYSIDQKVIFSTIYVLPFLNLVKWCDENIKKRLTHLLKAIRVIKTCLQISMLMFAINFASLNANH